MPNRTDQRIDIPEATHPRLGCIAALSCAEKRAHTPRVIRGPSRHQKAPLRESIYHYVHAGRGVSPDRWERKWQRMTN